jgi:hypothetical protein
VGEVRQDLVVAAERHLLQLSSAKHKE